MTQEGRYEDYFYKVGDRLTLPGQFKRRTIWQWIRREPRVHQTFVVTAAHGGGGGYIEYEPIDV